ncbi:unnamed protein product [Rhodiola kirilowii]
MAVFHYNIITPFLLCLCSAILLRTIIQKLFPRPGSKFPPSPPAYPIIGHLHLLTPVTHQAFHKLTSKYGPIIQLYLGSNRCIVVSTPEIAKECLRDNSFVFSNRPASSNATYMTYNRSDFAMASYGPYWKFMKKLCMTELLGTKTLDRFGPIREDEVTKLVKLVSQKGLVNEEVDVGAEMIRVTNNNITRMMMGRGCSEDANEAIKIRELIKEMVQLSGKFNLSDSFWFLRGLDLQKFKKRLERARGDFDSMFEKILGEHEDARKMRKGAVGLDHAEKDLLDILLDISEDESSEMKLSKVNIKAFIMNIFGAGTDSSALTVEWAMAELINNPNCMKQAIDEIDSVVGKERLVKESDIANLQYLQAIVKETLRLHPTGPLVARKSTQHCTINGYDIPANTNLFVNLWSIGKDPDHWIEPLKFMPERFMAGKDNNLDWRGQQFHYMPFGSGPRGCPGASLAMRIVPTCLASLIQCFNWKLSGQEVNCQFTDMEEAGGLTLRKARSLVCIASLRLPQFPPV